jgi:hypothetical protein
MDSVVFRLLSILIVLPIARMDRDVFRHADFARRLRRSDLQLFIGTLAIIHIFDCAEAGLELIFRGLSRPCQNKVHS